MTALRGCDDGPFGLTSRRSFYHARRAPDAPSAETLARLEPRPVFRTDVHGDIEISTDGDTLWPILCENLGENLTLIPHKRRHLPDNGCGVVDGERVLVTGLDHRSPRGGPDRRSNVVVP